MKTENRLLVFTRFLDALNTSIKETMNFTVEDVLAVQWVALSLLEGEGSVCNSKKTVGQKSG